MIIQTSYFRSQMFWILQILAIIAFPAALYAEKTTDVNTGGEPGDGCEAVQPGFVCSAIHAAPLSGQASVAWIGGEPIAAEFSGRVDQFGPGTCFIEAADAGLGSELFPQGKTTFDNLRASDLRGVCLQNIFVDGGAGCQGSTLEQAEVLAANRLTRLADGNSFLVEVLVLPINCTFNPSP